MQFLINKKCDLYLYINFECARNARKNLCATKDSGIDNFKQVCLEMMLRVIIVGCI